MEDCLALQNLQVPVESINREMPSRNIMNLLGAHPRYALRSRARCRGDRGLSAAASVTVKIPGLGANLKPWSYQHNMLRQQPVAELCRAAANVSLHTILLGVGSTILESLKNLSLDP